MIYIVFRKDMNVIFIFSQRLRVTKLKTILFDFEHLKKENNLKIPRISRTYWGKKKLSQVHRK